MSPIDPIILRAGMLEAHVHPACGARIGRFFTRLDAVREFDFLMPLAESPFDQNAWPKAGCFPMLPFADKLAGNQLHWKGRTVEVAEPGGPPWFHGWGLRSAWDLVARDGQSCELRMRFDGSTRWPWPFAARLQLALDPSGLDVLLTLSNLAHEPMPAGIGIHPYFRWPAGTVGRVQGKRVWIADMEHPGAFLPYDSAAAEEWLTGKMDDPASPPNLFFEDWNGNAHIDYPGMRLTLSSTTPGFLTTFAPKNGAGYVCLEPGTCLPGHFGDGIAAGAVQQVHLRLAVS